jgi:hypothetical protein
MAEHSANSREKGSRKTYEDKNTLHIILPGLDLCFVVTFSLIDVDRPKLGGSLVIFFGIGRLVRVIGDDGCLAGTPITLRCCWGDGISRSGILFSCGFQYDGFIKLRLENGTG